jgi:GNAT superfamily N-acetyltransferase
MTNPSASLTRFSRNELEIRPAAQSDRPEIEAIAAQTWEGNDYLPNVLDEWFNEESGAFNIISHQNKVVCVGKLTKIGEGEWWMEGLRVDPAYQGKGLARIMHHYLVTQARQLGSGIVRFATGNHNDAVNHLALETGFQDVGRYAYYKAEADTTLPQTWYSLTLQDLSRLQTWLNHSSLFKHMQHSFEDHWKWYIATEKYLQKCLEANEVYGWSPKGDTHDLQGVIVTKSPKGLFRHDSPNQVRLGFIDANSSHETAIWQAAKGLAAQLGYQKLIVHLYDAPPYIEAATQAGWVYGREDLTHRAVLYSRPTSLTGNVQVEHEQLPVLNME